MERYLAGLDEEIARRGLLPLDARARVRALVVVGSVVLTVVFFSGLVFGALEGVGSYRSFGVGVECSGWAARVRAGA